MPSTFKTLILALLITFSFLAANRMPNAGLVEANINAVWGLANLTDSENLEIGGFNV